MNTIKEFFQNNIMALLLIVSFGFFAGCSSIRDIPNPYQTGKTAYTFIAVAVDDDDIGNVNKIIDDIHKYTQIEDLSNDKMIGELSALLAQKYDKDMIYLVANILSEYWEYIDVAYLKGKLPAWDNGGKMIERIEYFIMFVQGLVDQKNFQLGSLE